MSPCGNIGGKQEAGMKCVNHAASHGRVSREEVTTGTKCPVCEYVWHIQGLAKKWGDRGLHEGVRSWPSD